MSTGKLIGILAGVFVLCIAASGLVGWGVASATLANSHVTVKSVAGPKGDTGAIGATGAAGATGRDGTNGSNGVAGARGATGATGARGTNGKNGTNGTNGTDGVPGPPGAPGTSAPTYSLTTPGGLIVPGALSELVGADIGPVPAGPALVGFSLTITDPNVDTVSCSLVNETTHDAVASTASLPFASNQSVTFATTEVVTLSQATQLGVWCGPFSFGLPVSYSDLSVYAISFATS